MLDNQIYHWLKLGENFFDDDAIKWLEKKGIEYTYFYIKLCTKALRYNGYMIQKIGKIYVPFDAESLADLTHTNIDTVVVAMELLKKIGLVEITDSGEIYIEQVKQLTGKETKWAQYKRNEREKNKLLDNVQNDSKKCLIDIDIELDKELDKDKCDFKKSLPQKKQINQEIIDKWNSVIERPKIYKLTDTRIKKINKLLNEYDLQTVLNTIDKVKNTAFLMGNNNRGWHIDFDFFINPNNFLKIIEGKYENSKGMQLQRDIDFDDYEKSILSN